jgi:predicted NUDIX family NTP pyrophosphohydrolase
MAGRMSRRSAGILLYRWTAYREIEVLLGHPGGPYFAKKDDGAWGIPKGESEPGETEWEVARREFEEETGFAAPDGSPIELGEIVQKGGKEVIAWALEGDLDPTKAASNLIEIEWPPRSGRWTTIPELDRVAWYTPDAARRAIRERQAPFVDRLLVALGLS